MTFAEWVAKHPVVDAARLARRAIKEVPRLAAEAVTREIEHLRRGEVGAVEIRAFRSALRALQASGRPTVVTEIVRGQPRTIAVQGRTRTDMTQFLELLRQPFALGDGSKVLWGDATPEQHSLRVALLKGQIGGIQATIRRHEEAITAIKGAHATCLNDLLKAKGGGR